ncbi:hypothetical protein GOP47_0006595 [Adiantum capillus-veneris]|uniref:Uncharacterized protein n=1 Tax=Adiantum capillus-veneris TaxID=13818 RepID=A0A9D4ZKJ8_ADICA|nr:hypothetical protein GOP47_0006595 [Adiantum capillus-veneris]
MSVKCSPRFSLPALGHPLPAPCPWKQSLCVTRRLRILPQHIRPSLKHTVVPLCSSSSTAAGADLPPHDTNSSSEQPPLAKRNIWTRWQGNAAKMRAQVAKLGLAAVLAYGLFDGITYTTFFVLAFLGYEKSTGKNPAANIQALLGETM